VTRRVGTASGTLAADPSLHVGAGTLGANPSDISGRPSSGSLDTAKDSSTHRGTSNKVHVELPCPTTRRGRSLSDVVASVPLPLVGLSLRVLLQAPLLPSVQQSAREALVASSAVHLVVCAALLPSSAVPPAFFAAPLVSFAALLLACVALLLARAALLPVCAVLLLVCTAPLAFSAAHLPVCTALLPIRTALLAFSATLLASSAVLLASSVALPASSISLLAFSAARLAFPARPLALSDLLTVSPVLPGPCPDALEALYVAASPQ
jgi:hypothetical protein